MSSFSDYVHYFSTSVMGPGKKANQVFAVFPVSKKSLMNNLYPNVMFAFSAFQIFPGVTLFILQSKHSYIAYVIFPYSKVSQQLHYWQFGPDNLSWGALPCALEMSSIISALSAPNGSSILPHFTSSFLCFAATIKVSRYFSLYLWRDGEEENGPRLRATDCPIAREGSQNSIMTYISQLGRRFIKHWALPH